LPPMPPAPVLPALPKLTQEQLVEVNLNLAKLDPADRKAAEAQRLCPVLKKPLGSMGPPIKVDLGGGRTAFICCEGCGKKAIKDRDATHRKVQELKALPPLDTGVKP